MNQKDLDLKMNNFIQHQISKFGTKKFHLDNLISRYATKGKYLVVEIMDNNIILHDPIKKIAEDIYNRKNSFLQLLYTTAEKYKLPDTAFVVHIADGYSYDGMPVFNYALPDGVEGLIVPDFSMVDKKGPYDDKLREIKNYNPKTDSIISKIYFKGGKTSDNRSKIREKLSESEMPETELKVGDYPFEPQKCMKKYKFLFDLPGVKPWSVRFKFLMATNRGVMRISFYDPHRTVVYGNNRTGIIAETSYWKQYIDFLFEENVDYIHLVYPLNYDTAITNEKLNEIKSDIRNKFVTYDQDEDKYEKMVASMNKKNKFNTLNNACLYLSRLLHAYNNHLINKATKTSTKPKVITVSKTVTQTKSGKMTDISTISKTNK